MKLGSLEVHCFAAVGNLTFSSPQVWRTQHGPRTQNLRPPLDAVLRPATLADGVRSHSLRGTGHTVGALL